MFGGKGVSGNRREGGSCKRISRGGSPCRGKKKGYGRGELYVISGGTNFDVPADRRQDRSSPSKTGANPRVLRYPRHLTLCRAKKSKDSRKKKTKSLCIKRYGLGAAQGVASELSSSQRKKTREGREVKKDLDNSAPKVAISQCPVNPRAHQER